MEQEILNSLNREWKATFTITRATGFNFYDVKEKLEEMLQKNIVEKKVRGKKGKIFMWRLAEDEYETE